jgi:hypothetical protein
VIGINNDGTDAFPQFHSLADPGGMNFGLQFGGSVFSLNLGPILVIFEDIFKMQPLLSKS